MDDAQAFLRYFGPQLGLSTPHLLVPETVSNRNLGDGCVAEENCDDCSTHDALALKSAGLSRFRAVSRGARPEIRP